MHAHGITADRHTQADFGNSVIQTSVALFECHAQYAVFVGPAKVSMPCASGGDTWCVCVCVFVKAFASALFLAEHDAKKRTAPPSHRDGHAPSTPKGEKGKEGSEKGDELLSSPPSFSADVFISLLPFPVSWSPLQPRLGQWKIRGISLPFGRLSLNSLSVRATTVREESNLHVDIPAICHRHDYDLMWFGHRDTVVYGDAGGNWSANWIEL